ncbi:MAG: methionyl-tRNA formyltransferase [Desulfovibrio sp.]|nr:methionyl-tRNA formyltransferase [Desulfovibrio sp.]
MAQEKKAFRLVFMGTPLFSSRILEYVAGWDEGEIVGVFTQPDRPKNRGHACIPSPVKERALYLGIPVFQPENFKNDTSISLLADLAPDFLLVAAYGLLLPREVLSIPRVASLNVHASLLPRYRGAAPVQRAIMEEYGENAHTGISIMGVEEALDAGPVYKQVSVTIGENTADTLLEKLAETGGKALLGVLRAFAEGSAQCVPQDDSLATYAAKIQKSEGIIQWNSPFDKVHAHIRAVTSKPGAHTCFAVAGRDLQVILRPGRRGNISSDVPGSLVLSADGLGVACSDYYYMITEIKPRGKAFMSAKAFVNGYLRDCTGRLCGHVIMGGQGEGGCER